MRMLGMCAVYSINSAEQRYFVTIILQQCLQMAANQLISEECLVLGFVLCY